MNEGIFENLMDMMGKTSPFDGKIIHQNMTYNDLLFCYLSYYDGLGERPLKPNKLTKYTAIDRAIRDLPLREKNLSEEERYRRYYAEKLAHV